MEVKSGAYEQAFRNFSTCVDGVEKAAAWWCFRAVSMDKALLLEVTVLYVIINNGLFCALALTQGTGFIQNVPWAFREQTKTFEAFREQTKTFQVFREQTKTFQVFREQTKTFQVFRAQKKTFQVFREQTKTFQVFTTDVLDVART